ncbi:MAG: penicillin-binding transpeptidase domain-containing protein, partial [Defluviitaleaceae bacterium]|nr:penicillin-binding transpeptidase domain-containing protein [Defluviitaleaceae bacterium]
AQMARGMAIIANRGKNFPLRLVGRVENFSGVSVLENKIVPIETQKNISQSTWDAVHEGMRLVTEPGAGGTAVGVFRNFPIRVAGKTGTAEQIGTRFSHTAFGGFAPYENPQIAVYVNVPFSATRAYSQLASHIARDTIGAAMKINARPELPCELNVLR